MHAERGEARREGRDGESGEKRSKERRERRRGRGAARVTTRYEPDAPDEMISRKPFFLSWCEYELISSSTARNAFAQTEEV